nr:MAG TPA: hypothetical protein [Caudoviricetes sp.]
MCFIGTTPKSGVVFFYSSFLSCSYCSFYCKVSEQKKHKENTKKKQTTITSLCDLYRTFALIIKAKWHGKQNR